MFLSISSVSKLESDLIEQNKEQALVYKKLLELDPNTIDSAKEGAPVVGRDVLVDREEVVVEELLEISKDAAREALCEALIFYLGVYINLMFG